MTFKLEMECSQRQKDSNIILALDVTSNSRKTLLSKSLKLLEKTHLYICAVKLNHHLTLPLGLFNDVQQILRLAHKHELPIIMDCKINDIGNTNRVIAENYYKAGFDAVIANPFVGWEEGLQPVFQVAQRTQKGVILLCYMSHKAAWEGYGQTVQEAETEKLIPQYLAFAKKALEWKADGVVVGATYPGKIKGIAKILTDKVPIYSPGVGVQGGDVQSTVEAGARYLIVGRTIVNSPNPAATARQIREEAKIRKKL
jgi:orotidine-5'-phosphate decarboxylase